MQHVSRRRPRRRPRPGTAQRTISRIARRAAQELDRVSLERVGMLVEDGSPGAMLAARWEAQALAERGEYAGLVSTTSGDLVCRTVR